MMGFRFKGVHSSSFGLSVKTRSLPFLMNAKYETVEIPGANRGILVFENGKEDMVIVFECLIKGEYRDREPIRVRLREWLVGNGELTVDLNGKSYQAKGLKISGSLLERKFETFILEFTCSEVE